MIKINVFNDELKDSLLTQTLYSYLKSKGHNEIDLQTQSIDGAKADIATMIAIASLIVSSYPIIKDLSNWARPKQYSITLNDGKVSATINDLDEKEYLEILNKLNKEVTFIEVN